MRNARPAKAKPRARLSTATPQVVRGDRIPRAYHQLRELIVSGRLAPGSRIIESDIAERLGVSRTPVRSALHRLQQEGYIAGTGRGNEPRLTVAPLTQDDARDLFAIIGAIEGLAAQEAAALARPARRKLVATMRELNGGLRQAAAATRPDPMRIFHLDTSFHQSYVEAGAGPRLLALHNAIKPQAERYVRLYTSALVDEIAQSVVEHERIIEEIDTGGAEGARRAVQRNWRNAAGRLSSVIRTLGERGSW